MSFITPLSQSYSLGEGAKNFPLERNPSINEGKTYKKLGNFERFSRLSRIITTLFFKLITFGYYKSYNVGDLWQEFKSGKKIIKSINLNSPNSSNLGNGAKKVDETVKGKSQLKIEIPEDSNKQIIVTPDSPSNPSPIGSKTPSPHPLTPFSPLSPPSPLKSKEIFKTPKTPVGIGLKQKDSDSKQEKPSDITPIDQELEQALNHPNILQWLETFEDDDLLNQTDLYKTLNDLYDSSKDGNEKTEDEQAELEAKYLQIKDEIVVIQQTGPSDLFKITELQTHAFAFNLLKNNFKEIHAKVSNLKDVEEGKFKTNLLALCQLISPPSTPTSKDGNGQVAFSSEVSFMEFLKLIHAVENENAHEAFMMFKEVLKKDLKLPEEELSEYQQYEAEINQTIKKMSNPLQILDEKALTYSDKELYLKLKEFNEILKKIPDLSDKPFLKQLLIQKNDLTIHVYQKLEERTATINNNADLLVNVLEAKNLMELHLGISKKMRLNFALQLGEEVLFKPAQTLNKYLNINGGLQFCDKPPASSADIEKFLENIHEMLDEKPFSVEDLLALEAFTLMTMYTYIINPETYLDSSFKPIADELGCLRNKVQGKLNDKSIQSKVASLRKDAKHQEFYQFLKDKIQETPDYPKDFWKNPSAAKKMAAISPIVDQIGVKIASSKISLESPILLVQKYPEVGYEMHFHPGSKTEKPKLLFFINKETGTSPLQEMNHQLGLFGDNTLLKGVEEVLSHITSTELLEGYIQDLKDGKIDIVVSGFNDSGSIGTILASRLANIYPQSQVLSIAAGSTTVVTTEDAYNIKKSENFLPIRLRYPKDNSINRKVGFVGDFSEDLYQTFPLQVRYQKKTVDVFKHNPEEYGNIHNFVPAMKNPLILREIYQELSHHILPITDQNQDYQSDVPLKISAFLKKAQKTKNLFEAVPTNLQQAGQVVALIKLGDEILKAKKDKDKYNGAFLKFDTKSLHLSQMADEVAELEEAKKSWFSSLLAGNTKKAVTPPVKTSVLTIAEQEETAEVLHETLMHLSNPKVMDLLTPENAFSLLIAIDMLLINYTKINTNVGKLPHLVDLLSEMRHLTSQKLDALYHDKDHKDTILNLFKKKGVTELQGLAAKALELNPHYHTLFDDKDVLGRIDYEEQFLEYVGFKIAVKNQDKKGFESYVSKLHADNTNMYDISLFTPQDVNKKQRIVISLNHHDQLGAHDLSEGEFGAGDSAILGRAQMLKKTVIDQLNAQFTDHQFQSEHVDIVVVGFGSEGAVATALGSSLAKEFKDCQVQSLGFGAPRFTTKEGGDMVQKQTNFTPIRFLSSQDSQFEFKLPTIGDFLLADSTYYTIPFQFRIVAVTEKLSGHTPNLYGDVQGIKTSLKSAYLLRDVVHNVKKAKQMASKANKGNLPVKPVELPQRVIIDSRKNVLTELSKKDVAGLIAETPGKLIGVMKYCVELSDSESLPDEDKELIKSFFKTFIEAIKNDDINAKHPIKNQFFIKMENHGYKADQLFAGKWNLQRIISDELNDAMNAVTDADDKTSPKQRAELVLTRSYWRGVLAADLNGNRYKPAGGGVNGAVFFKHLEADLKKPEGLLPDEKQHVPFLGVFKPHPQTVLDFKGYLDAKQLGELAKTVFGMDSHLNQSDPNKRVSNEILAYEMFHIFGFDPYIGFPTTLKFTNKNDKKGRPASFCAFVPGFDMVQAHVKNLKNVNPKDVKSNILNDPQHAKDKFSQADQNELHIWQMSKIFDFLTGNMDGHEGNAFVKVEKGRITAAVNFDYDKAFAIEKTPNIGNQYKWGSLAISKHPLTKETKDALSQLFKDGQDNIKLNAFLERARQDNPKYFCEKQEALLKERIEILKQLATGEQVTLTGETNAQVQLTINLLSDLAKCK